jgi:VIT1/CCC1 family predicted Fe2+/Mn2+ transporter
MTARRKPLRAIHPWPKSVKDVGKRHRSFGGGTLRAGVFGVNDGLVSNASLILGIAGASADPKVVLIAGAAGLVAGAFSMAAGEYVSVRSQRELYEYQIGLERDELEQYPEAEAQELALIYAAKGVPAKEAARIAQKLVNDPEHALDTLAREELGLNPAELGSPWGAAASSFLAFAGGALIPLAPYLVLRDAGALPYVVGATAIALFAIGALLSLFTGRGAVASGLRMLALGGTAALVTHGIGRLFGVALG